MPKEFHVCGVNDVRKVCVSGHVRKIKIAEYRFQCSEIKTYVGVGLEASDQKGNFRKWWRVNDSTRLLKKSICCLNQWHRCLPYNL